MSCQSIILHLTLPTTYMWDIRGQPHSAPIRCKSTITTLGEPIHVWQQWASKLWWRNRMLTKTFRAGTTICQMNQDESWTKVFEQEFSFQDDQDMDMEASPSQMPKLWPTNWRTSCRTPSMFTLMPCHFHNCHYWGPPPCLVQSVAYKIGHKYKCAHIYIKLYTSCQ